MSTTVVFPYGSLLNLCASNLRCYGPGRPLRQLSCFTVCRRLFANQNRNAHVSLLFRRIRKIMRLQDLRIYQIGKIYINEAHISGKEGHNKVEISFVVMIATAMGIAVIATIAFIHHQPILGSSFDLQIVSEGRGLFISEEALNIWSVLFTGTSVSHCHGFVS